MIFRLLERILGSSAPTPTRQGEAMCVYCGVRRQESAEGLCFDCYREERDAQRDHIEYDYL